MAARSDASAGIHDHAVAREIAAGEFQHLDHDFIDIERLLLDLAFLQEQPQPPDDFARALVLGHDVGENLPHLRKIGRVLREIMLGRLRIAEDGGERLVQLVRQRAGQLAEHGHAREMREFAAPFVQLLLRLLARRDVEGHAAHEDRFAIAVALDAAVRGNPTHPPVR